MPPPPVPAAHKDRRTGLVIFGIVEILLGAFFALTVPVVALGQIIIAQNPQTAALQDWRSATLSMAYMAALAVGAIWLGIGSIKARRWARALCLCIGWIWLIGGLFSCASLFWTLPMVETTMRASQQPGVQPAVTAMMITVAKITMVAVATVFYVVLPAVLVLFYRSPHVKRTCEVRDPVERWTDRCPLPVLALVLLQAVSAVCVLALLPLYGRAFPLFGILVTGWPAILANLAAGALFAGPIRAIYRQQINAWWWCTGTVLLCGASLMVTFARIDLPTFYQAAGMPAHQLQQLKATPFFQSPMAVWFGFVIILPWLGFLFWLKRYFGPSGQPPAQPSP